MDTIRFEAADILKCAGLAASSSTSGGSSGSEQGEGQQRPSLDDVNHVRDVVMCLRSLHLDTTEYACLKAIMLFRPGA